MPREIKVTLTVNLTTLAAWLDAHGRVNYHREGDNDNEIADAAGVPSFAASLVWKALESNLVTGWGVEHRYGYRWLVRR
jgi:hypothetical protein